MKTLICLSVLAFALISTPTPTKADVIVLYGDSLLGGSCHAFPGDNEDVLWFYVFHYSATGATGSRFLLPRSSCIDIGGVTGPTLTEPAFPSTGAYQTGIEFQYGACLTGWIHVALVLYWDVVGLSSWPPCCGQPVLAHPDAPSGQVEVFDCVGGTRVATGESGTINGDDSCPCGVATGAPGELISSTWGAIKSLYASD